MVCIVLAAGYATRMYPLTENFPKPLLEVRGKPILNWLLDDIDKIADVDKIIVVSNHKFISHFESWSQSQSFSKPLVLLDDGSMRNEERIGAVMDIKVALNCVNSPTDALIIAGDNVLEFSLEGFVGYFKSTGSSCIMCCTELDKARRRKTGIITLDADSRVTSFEEKPQEPKSDLAVPPFYAYTAADLARIDEAVSDGCGTDAPGSLAAWLSGHSAVHAWRMPGKRHDIGSLEGYREIDVSFVPYN